MRHFVFAILTIAIFFPTACKNTEDQSPESARARPAGKAEAQSEAVQARAEADVAKARAETARARAEEAKAQAEAAQARVEADKALAAAAQARAEAAKPKIVRTQIYAASQNWTTVMTVRSGQVLKIEAKGEWVAFPKYGPCDANGGKYPRTTIGRMVLDTEVIGYLEAKVGDGSPFKMGTGRGRYVVPGDGALQMRMYDDPTWGAAYSDNSGFIEVIVTDVTGN